MVERILEQPRGEGNSTPISIDRNYVLSSVTSLEVGDGKVAAPGMIARFQFVSYRQLGANSDASNRTDLLQETLTLDLTGLKVTDVDFYVLRDIVEVRKQGVAA